LEGNRLAEAGGVRAFVDDTRLIVQDFDKAVRGRVKILNMNSGMVGKVLPNIGFALESIAVALRARS